MIWFDVSDPVGATAFSPQPVPDEWNFENWGIKYWSRTTEFEESRYE
ncbi:MAG: hypothetical protein IKF90_14175 [Parasporobacterium sp.]|nr:hypothetical protein [Parasporobacterium sp.]